MLSGAKMFTSEHQTQEVLNKLQEKTRIVMVLL